MKGLETEKHTVVISGAGPAGTMASTFLSKAGIRHLLLDKSVFPRDKVCGDALSGKVFSVLNKIDPSVRQNMLDLPSEFIPCEGIVFVAPNGRQLDVPFQSKPSSNTHGPAGFVSPRLHFDQFIHRYLDSQTCDFRQGCEILDVARMDHEVSLTIKEGNNIRHIRTKLIIAGDGERSIIAKKLGGHQKALQHFSAGIRVYYEGVTQMHPKNYIELHFIKEFLPGYVWVFPLPNGRANVGAGILSSHISKNGLNLREMLQKTIREHPSLKERFSNAKPLEKVKGWGLPLGSRRPSISGDNFLLTGDAASLIDPFTGEGISNAMLSGMYAAEIASKAIVSNDYSKKNLMQYDQRVYQRLGGELKLSRSLQNLCRYPFLFNLVINKANSNKAFRETISCMFDDLDLRAKLRSPSFYFNLLFGRQ